MSDKKYYWGRFKVANGRKTSQWLDDPMTRSEMIEFDDTFRHRCKEVEDKPKQAE